MRKANDIATVSDTGIETLVRAYMTVNTICLPAGHYRVEEGSEHYLFYALEKPPKDFHSQTHCGTRSVRHESTAGKQTRSCAVYGDSGTKVSPEGYGYGEEAGSTGSGEFVRSRSALSLISSQFSRAQWKTQIKRYILASKYAFYVAECDHPPLSNYPPYPLAGT